VIRKGPRSPKSILELMKRFILRTVKKIRYSGNLNILIKLVVGMLCPT
jgi:hypothetical protein